MPRFRFPTIALSVLSLAAVGLLGTLVWSISVGLLSAGVGTIVILGFGLIFLVALVYLMFGVAWFEVERVNGLYHFGSPRLKWHPRVRPGFGGYLLTLWKQICSARMWRAIASFALATVIGLAIIQLLSFAMASVILLFAPLGSAETVIAPLGFETAKALAPIWGAIGTVLSLAAVWGLAYLHAIASRSLLALPTREALTVEAHTRTVQREGAVRAADVERTRIERDLHDGVQPRLVSVGMTLGMAQQKIDTDPEAAKLLLAEAHTSTKAAITELRQLARGIHASVLDDRGLDAALSAIAARSHIPVHLDVRLEGRPPAAAGPFRDAEAALYFTIAEALTNAAKHSRASECRVTVRLRAPGTPDAELWARVEDNGIGGAEMQPGGGIDGISNRALAAGGSLSFSSPQGGPTAVEVTVPCGS